MADKKSAKDTLDDFINSDLYKKQQALIEERKKH